VFAEQALWTADLAAVPGLAEAVTRGLDAILQHGMRGAVQALLQGTIKGLACPQGHSAGPQPACGLSNKSC
jgi:hypothetical protein